MFKTCLSVLQRKMFNILAKEMKSYWKRYGSRFKKYQKILLYFAFNFALSAWDNGTDIWAALDHFK